MKKGRLSETANSPTSDQLSTEKKVKSLLPTQGYVSKDKVSTNLLFPNCHEQVRERTAHCCCAPSPVTPP